MPSSRARRARLPIAFVLAVALGCTSLTAASADREDKLEHERSEVRQDINQAESSLDESSERLVQTSREYESAKQKLASARDTLDETQAELEVARAYDKTMQARLERAEQELEEAKADLANGRNRVKRAREKTQRLLVDQAVEGDPGLRALGSLLNGEDLRSYGVRMDYERAVSDAQSASLESLDARRVMLTVKRERVREARDRVAEERRKAARNLELKKELEQQAEQQAVQVEGLVDRTEDAREAANEAKQADLERLDDLEAERDRISGKLQRIAERERRQALREARRERREQRQQQRNDDSGGSTGNPGGDSGGDDSGGDPEPDVDPVDPDVGFSLGYPVASSYITSPYGMRYHPILHVYKLHDGTDFSAACGTPVMAAEDGTVTSAYYNAGYGNRIILNHGYHNGVSLATSYNHMTSFSVGVGQHVSKGQIIGYSGTTGYSTGCHMHFMVYENGSTVDPMSWL